MLGIRPVQAERTTDSADRQVMALAAVVAGVAIGRAIQFQFGSFDINAFPWLTAGLVACLLGLLISSNVTLERLVRVALPVVAVAALVFQFSHLISKPPGRGPLIAQGPNLGAFQFWLVCAAVISGATSANAPWLRRLQTPALLCAHFLCGKALIEGSPEPDIDVFFIHRDSVSALLQGHNPYTLTFPNLYHSTQYFGPGMATPDRLLFGYTYPPLSLILSIPGQVIGGDYRYSLLASMTLAGALLAYATPHPISRLCAALFLFTPRGFFVLERGWTEPYVVLLIAAAVFVAIRAPHALGWVIGALVASKQYTFLLAPLFLLIPRLRESPREFVRQCGYALISAMILILPFFLWSPRGFVFSLFTVQLGLPFRPDSLNFSALWYSKYQQQLPTYLGFLAYLVMLAVALIRAPKTAAGCAMGIATCMLAFVAINRQAFCNYYFLIVGALFTAAAATGASSPIPGSARLGFATGSRRDGS